MKQNEIVVRLIVRGDGAKHVVVGGGGGESSISDVTPVAMTQHPPLQPTCTKLNKNICSNTIVMFIQMLKLDMSNVLVLRTLVAKTTP